MRLLCPIPNACQTSFAARVFEVRVWTSCRLNFGKSVFRWLISLNKRSPHRTILAMFFQQNSASSHDATCTQRPTGSSGLICLEPVKHVAADRTIREHVLVAAD